MKDYIIKTYFLYGCRVINQAGHTNVMKIITMTNRMAAVFDTNVKVTSVTMTKMVVKTT